MLAGAHPSEALGSRLFIKSITLTNFKSYAGRNVLGPFNQSFSAIVGPNGSGKSNVIDAMLFVFGFRARKMRHEKVSGLVHTSNENPQTDCCSVEIEFQHGCPGRVLSVSRKAWLSGRSEYFVDGACSPFSEVSRLLKEHGVDLDHNRFLILQGEVESIALMKPKATNEHEEGLLEYLEDIMGTNRYIKEIDQAQAAFEQLGGQEAVAMAALKDAVSESARLEPLYQHHIALLEAENDISRKKHVLLQLERFGIEKEHQEGVSAVSTLQQELEDRTRAFENQISQWPPGDARELEAATVRVSELKNEHQKLKGILQEQESQLIRSMEDAKQAKQRYKKAVKAIDEEQTRQQQLTSQISALSREIFKTEAACGESLELLGRSKRQLQEMETVIEAKTHPYQQKLRSLTDEQLAPLRDQLNAAKDTLEAESREFNALQSEFESLNTAIVRHQHQATAESDRLRGKKHETEELSDCHLQLETKIKACQHLVSDLSQRVKISKKNLEILEEKNAASSQSSSRGGNHVTRLCDMLVNDAKVQGVIGKLGDLGSVDAKYAVAVCVAAGQALESIVVESPNSAQLAVQVLRQKNAGRATFIIRSKITKFKAPERDLPAPRLVDMVQVHDALNQDAFYHALRETLVAENLQEASRIAFCGKRRFRVVTLDGKLIDTNGTMSGGGNSSAPIALKIAVTGKDSQRSAKATDAKAIAKAFKEAELELSAAESEHASAVAELEQLLIISKETEVAIAKGQLEVESIRGQLAILQSYVNDYQKRLNLLNSHDCHRRQLERRIPEQRQKVEVLQNTMHQLDTTISGLREEILEVGGLEYRALVSQVENYLAAYEHENNRLLQARAELSLCSEKSASLQVEFLQQKSVAAQCSIDAVERNVQQCRNAVELSRRSLAQGETNLAAAGDQLEELATMYQNRDSLQLEFQSFATQQQQRVSQLRSALTKAEDRLSEIEQSLGQLSLFSEDTFEEKKLLLLSSDELERSLVYHDRLQKELQSVQVVAREHPNFSLLSEYRNAKNSLAACQESYDQCHQDREHQRSACESAKARRHSEFMHGLGVISQRLRSTYQHLTLGGNAELELVDSLDPFAEGILFSVMPPKKTWKNIVHLSGGEKTLSSLALVFALHAFRPTPFYVMDEIDAALDHRNVSIVARYIHEQTSVDAQFIVVSLRSDMFEAASELIGIYKQRNASRAVCFSPPVAATA